MTTTTTTEHVNEIESSHAGFIAVHVGAGLQSQARLPRYRETIKRACLQGIRALNNGKNASEVACMAVAVLEDCPLTNAGIGSNLTLDGDIECDASIMDEESYGAVGAVSNIQNPITLAWALLHTQKQGLMEGGRIPPCFLVGTGAKQWAEKNGISLIDNQHMKTENSIYMLEKYKRKLEEKSSNSTKRIKTDNDDAERLDTVGAIVIDRNGNVAAAASSGGILLKHAGRVGHSAMFGCGCWAERKDSCSMAVASSGTGEFLMKSLFSKSISDACAEDDLTPETVQNHINRIFLNRTMTPTNAQKLFGFILLKQTNNEQRFVEFLCAHNTQTMFIGYMNTFQTHVTTLFSELNSNQSMSINLDGINLSKT